jgi:DNA-directed RNA polymerase specialized sigma24 family protein
MLAKGGDDSREAYDLVLSGTVYEWRPPQLPATRERRWHVFGLVARMSGASLFGEKDMTKGTPVEVREHYGSLYASHEDFHTIFNEDLKQFFQISFLLTGDPAKAERCLVSGLEDCFSGNRVFREWARSWAKRAIVQNAIRELKPRPSQSNSPLSKAMFTNMHEHARGPGGHFEIDAVLRLADFDRFVFVMSVLEHYSEHDCALLLGCSVGDIREGRTRALKELADSPHMEPSENQLFRAGKEVK